MRQFKLSTNHKNLLLHSEATLIRTLDILMPQLYENFGQDKSYQINAFLLQLYGCHTYSDFTTVFG